MTNKMQGYQLMLKTTRGAAATRGHTFTVKEAAIAARDNLRNALHEAGLSQRVSAHLEMVVISFTKETVIQSTAPIGPKSWAFKE